MSCQCRGIEDEFNARLARRELRSYRKRGPRKTTRALIDTVRSAVIAPVSLLDIGGGVGAIQHELAKAGVDEITNIDASTAYLDAAREEGDRLGLGSSRTYLKGDYVALDSAVPQADVVTLDRVLCCYDDVDRLVALSAAKAKKVYGLVYPRVNLLSRFASRGVNVMMKIRGSCFRSFLHDPRHVEQIVTNAGLARFSLKQGILWQVVVYVRPD